MAKKYIIHILSYVSLLLLLMTIGLCNISYCEEKDGAFYPGEKLVFDLNWGILPAGEAILEVADITTFNGLKVYHFVMTAKTSGFVDFFYTVRSHIESYTPLDISRSLFFKKDQREGRTKRNIEVTFNWEKNKAQCSSYGKIQDPISIFPGTLDPLSALYAFRLCEIKENSEIKMPVTDGEKFEVGVAPIFARETIEVSGIEYDTYLVEPDTKKVSGLFVKSDDAKVQVWVTADKRHIPVKLKSKVFIGSFTGELVPLEEKALEEEISKEEDLKEESSKEEASIEKDSEEGTPEEGLKRDASKEDISEEESSEEDISEEFFSKKE